MAQYIDKDALVAWLKERIRDYWSDSENTMGIFPYALEEVIKYVDTLEVKEDNLFTEKKTEKELAEDYINIFDKKFGNNLPKLKGNQLAEFKNFINTCEQTFHIKYFDYHATQGKLFEKLALLWAAWGKDHLDFEVKEVDLKKKLNWHDYINFFKEHPEYSNRDWGFNECWVFAEYCYKLGLKVQKGE